MSFRMIYMTRKEGNNDEFYEILQRNTKVSVRSGVNGTNGETFDIPFDSTAEASLFVNNTAKDQKNNGYVDGDETAADDSEIAPVTNSTKRKSVNVAMDDDFIVEDSDEENVSTFEDDGSIEDENEITSKKTRGKKAVVPKKQKVTNNKTVAPVSAVENVSFALNPPSKNAIAATAAKNSTSTNSGNTSTIIYLTCTEGNSDKFYEIGHEGLKVSIRYGRSGTEGTSSLKTFNSPEEALKFVNKTRNEKMGKGYKPIKGDPPSKGESSANSNAGDAESSGDLNVDLENGLKVFVKGSSALPYMLKKFNGGYSCSCQGWAMQIHIKGVQAASCKHLKQVRGDDAEAERCGANPGVKNPVTGKKEVKNTSIPSKISLAQAWKLTTDPTGYIMSEKLDGMRAYWNGDKLFSRAGNPIVAPDWFIAQLPADMHLDGELFLGRGKFQDLVSITRRSDGGGDWNKVQYVIFDAPNIKGGIMQRLEAATFALSLDPSPYSVIHPQLVCESTEHLLDELARVEQLQGEGLMLRNATASHRGGRTSDLLKVKSFQDDEVLVIDYEAGKGKYGGNEYIGSLVCVLRTGSRFKVGSGLTDVQRLKRNAPKKGTVITVKFFELTVDGIPRFPTFLRVRPDVSKDEFPAEYL